MERIQELLAVMEAANTEIETLEGKRDGSTEDAEKAVYQKEIDAKSAEYDKAKGELASVKAKAARAKEIADTKATMQVDTSKKAELEGTVEMPDSEHNRMVEGKKLDEAAVGYMIDPSFKASNFLAKTAASDERLLDALRVEHQDGKVGYRLPSYMRDYIINPILGKSREDLERTMGGKQVLVADAPGVLSGGGSLVPEVFVTELYKYPQIEFRLVDRCRVKRAVGNTAEFPRLGQGDNRFGVVATWGNEGAAFGGSNPAFNQLVISTGRLGLLTQASIKEMRVNRVGLQAELGWMFRGAWNQAVTQAIIQGSGANNRPFGVNTNAAIALGVNAIPREAVNQISYNDLVRLTFAVADALTEDGIFILQSGQNGGMAYVAALDDAQGRPVLRNEQTGWQVGLPGRLLGLPYFMTPDNLAALGQRGDVIYGNWMNYGVAIDNDITIDRSDHFAFDTGLITFRMHSYIGGQALGPDAFSVLADEDTASSSSSSSSSSS